MTNNPIYLDAAASTPINSRVSEIMIECLNSDEFIGNPSSANSLGQKAMQAVDVARQQLADLVGTDASNLIWTSGATESNNLAIIGAARFRSDNGRHLITMKTEHKAVSAPFDYLEKEGFKVTRLLPDETGLLNINDLRAAITSETQLVSIMHLNNETGVVQNIIEIGELCREFNVLFHTDAAQSVGKLPLNLDQLPVDFLSVSAHKMYGPQGIGALFVRKAVGCGIIPLFYGGEQEKWMRPGTLPVHQIVGFGLAAEIAISSMKDDIKLMHKLYQRMWSGIQNNIGIIINGSTESYYPGILNVSLPGIDGDSLMLMLEPICVARGSACNSKFHEASHVLKSLGLSDHLAQSAIRFSFNRNTQINEIDFAIEKYNKAVDFLRKITPDEL
jgi:cysteine desulfurase